jgi:hypothetical protein
MNFDLRRMTMGDAFGSLLDIAADSGLEQVDLRSSHQFGVGRHWQAVGDRMRAAMKAVAHEQGIEQETADRQK